MKKFFNDRVRQWFPLKNGNLKVRLEDDEGLDDYDKAKSINTMPSHFGTFILSHSKRFMNDVTEQTCGFYNNSIYYTDTDSLYIHKKDGLTWLILDSSVKLLAQVKLISVIRVNFTLGCWL